MPCQSQTVVRSSVRYVTCVGCEACPSVRCRRTSSSRQTWTQCRLRRRTSRGSARALVPAWRHLTMAAHTTLEPKQHLLGQRLNRLRARPLHQLPPGPADKHATRMHELRLKSCTTLQCSLMADGRDLTCASYLPQRTHERSRTQPQHGIADVPVLVSSVVVTLGFVTWYRQGDTFRVDQAASPPSAVNSR